MKNGTPGIITSKGIPTADLEVHKRFVRRLFSVHHRVPHKTLDLVRGIGVIVSKTLK